MVRTATALLAFFLFIPFAAAAPTEPGTTPTVHETDKMGKFGPGEEESPLPDTDTSYRELAYEIAAQHGVSGAEMVRVIDCENRPWNPELQSMHRYKAGNRWGFPEGTREKSYGLVMIHLPDHPNITYEQATDPVFALTFMAEKFAQGRQRMWSCY